MRHIILKSFPLLFLILLFASCGNPESASAGQETDYRQYAGAIRELTETLPRDLNERDARRFLSQLEKVLRPLNAPEAQNDLTVVPVYVNAVEPEYIAEKVQYLGDIAGDPSVIVYPKLSDIIRELRVVNGDYVKKGQILAVISDATVRSSKSQAEAAYLSAKSQLANVRVEFERMKTLHDAKAISQSQWDQIVTQREVAEAGLRQAEAAMELAETQLSYAMISAPISGYISNLAYEPGDMTTPQKPFASIHQINSVKTRIKVTESDLGHIKADQRCEISVSAYPGEIFEGRVTNISPVIDPLTRSALIEILAENKDLRLKPGMFARVNIITRERPNALTIEKAVTGKQTVLRRFGATLRDDQPVETYHCFVVRDGIAIRTPIEIGIESKTKYEVIDGLHPGDLLVVMGQNNLRDSTLVEIVK
ncbi:MAG: efflux RND transporter periplasmic adaptor subunit [Candidatus Neomarinimicrobiota bacterium]|jgi:RND family efflux transporter MFP subunit|nr:efflux RND transporter periplasmic adaptor subunit [Candidatus Neomarinimicrobiota bacterium]MDD3965993.1 efflux RND transporter periplasmic adaptor subunit [Candidatus Neomarinimicrobiota bacterium]MDX9779865.1 efflux RND transporter periplasmic adaptor subunit [bacterium]